MSIRNSRVIAALFAASMLVPSAGRAEDLAANVAAKLRDSGAMSGYRVSVRSEDGTIFLTGAVGSPQQIEMAVTTAENTPGVERVVNRLSVAKPTGTAAKPQAGSGSIALALPASLQAVVGLNPEKQPQEEPKQDAVQLTQATTSTAPVAREIPEAAEDVRAVYPKPPAKAAGSAAKKTAAPIAKARKPRPLGSPVGQPMAQQGVRRAARGPIARTGGLAAEPMIISDVVVGEGTPVPQGGTVGDGQMVPGSERIVGDSGSPGYAVGVAGRPLPMGAGRGGMPMVPTRGEGPNVPNYAWPSYAASPNYAAVQYPSQYSPTAWPYIGPFYPYPQVPLGWRRVSLEWDDGWWFLDFDDDHHRRGHHGH